MHAEGQTASPSDRNDQTSVSESDQNRIKRNVASVLGWNYQILWLMKFLFWAIVKQKQKAYSYERLGTEVKAAGKYDDLVYECMEVKNGAKQGLLLQCKHTANEGSRITSEALLDANNGDFSLRKYFLSYMEIIDSELLNNGYQKALVIVTNYIFDTEELKTNKIEIESSSNAIWESLIEDDSKKGNCYKLSTKGDLIQLLEEQLKQKLVKDVVDNYLKNKVMSHETDIFKLYHVYLAKKVFDIETKKFLEDETELGQQIFAGIMSETNNEINGANVNANKAFNKRKTGLQFSAGFGEVSGSGERSITDCLNEFLDRLIFAVDQPNVGKLTELIKEDLLRYYDRDAEKSKDMYLRLEFEVKAFSQNNKQAFLSSEEAEGIICSIKPPPIIFNLSPVQKSFAGRTVELAKMREALKTAKTAIIGMAGVGKTELARKYAHEYGTEYDFIFWFDAEEITELEKSFCSLAQDKFKIGLANQDESKMEISIIVEDVYKLIADRKCLVIFDNIDNINIEGFLPKTTLSVDVLITCQKQNCIREEFEVINLEGLTETEAIEFVKQALDLDTEEEKDLTGKIKELTETLQCIPSRFQEAIAYIRTENEAAENLNQQFTIEDYLKKVTDDKRAQTTKVQLENTVEHLERQIIANHDTITKDMALRMWLLSCHNM